MMTGWHNNKNITIVPEVLKCLKDMGVNDVTFVITVDWSDVRSVKLMKRAKEYGVSENIFFTGQISPVAIPDLISQVHIIALFSLLESFSNNIIESWYFEKPLIISDEEWSRAICDNAAVYVNRDDALNIAETIISLNADAQFKATIVQNGTIMLESYPSPSEKVKMQFDFIKKICDESRS
jgi:glycosyltransferase involved in cell wall biosynthesis